MLREERARGTLTIGLSTAGHAVTLPGDDPRAIVAGEGDAWRFNESLGPAARTLFDLYLPLLSPLRERRWVIAHLGQSLDGHIATENGDSCYVTGPENLTHLHRMRALCDAVIVGAGTVEADNPRLTTRRVAGTHPVRVVLDPGRRLRSRYHLFNDGLAPTLVVCAQGQGGKATLGQATVLEVPARGRSLDLTCLLELLCARGLRGLFVEGGGTTVSRFLQAALLDRLQIAVAPLLIGSGRPGIRLSAVSSLQACLRPPVRLFRMGRDMLFDFDLRAARDESPATPSADAGSGDLVRIL
jgi:riboflavin-specific deaminase-like protein